MSPQHASNAHVLIRENVEDRELANYVALSTVGRGTSVIGSHVKLGPYASSGLGMNVTTLGSVGSALRAIGLGPVASRMGRRRDLDRLLRLRKQLPYGAVVNTNELHSASSAQVVELTRTRPDITPVVVCYENIPFNYEDGAVMSQRRAVVRSGPAHFVALTPDASDALAAEGVEESRIVVLPYGVDADQFSPAQRSERIRQKWGAGPDDVVFLFAGRLVREKGLADLVRAFQVMKGSAARLVIVGTGPEEFRLRLAVQSYGLGQQVLFEDWVDRDRMAEHMASADVYVMLSSPTPYWTEQLGFAALEAMSCGVPILATARSSLPFVVGPGGLIVQPYDIGAIADAVLLLSKSPNDRSALSQEARRHVLGGFTTQHFATGYGSYLKSLGVPT